MDKNQFSSVAQPCPNLATPWTAACQASLFITNSWITNLLLVLVLEGLVDLQIPYDYTVEVPNRFKGLDLIDRVLKKYGWRFVRQYRR